MSLVIIIIELVLTAAFLAAGISAMRKRSALLSRQSIRNQQQLERNLDEMISNPSRAGEESSVKLRPYEEKYSGGSSVPGLDGSGIRVEIKVGSPVTERRYLTEITDALTIGSDPDNDLVIDSRMTARKQCILFRKNSRLYIRNLARDKSVIAERSRSRRKVTDSPVEVRSQDKYYMGDITLEVLIL